MKKFILLTFGFLGWAFYEMSGGADFVPASALVTPVEETVLAAVPAEGSQPPVEGEELPQDQQQETAAVVDTTPVLTPLPDEVTRVALNLTTLQDVIDDAATVVDQAVAEVVSNEATSGVPTNPGFSVSSADTPTISVFAAAKASRLAVNSIASVVHPGVSSLG